jgi:predicted PurR-regulated permease PerM
VLANRQAWFWGGLIAVAAFLAYAVSAALAPFVGGIVVAYLLNPLANRLERLGLSRLVATSLIIGAVVFVVILGLLILLPIAVREVIAFAQRLPQIFARLHALVLDQALPGLEKLGIDIGKLSNSDSSITDFVRQAANWLVSVVQSIWTGGQALVSFVSIAVIMPFVAFYLLLDWHKLVGKVDSWLPLPHRPVLRQLIGDIDRAIAGFIRGQAVVCLFLGFFYAFALTICGLNFALLIGLGAGLISFVPFVGTMIGFVAGMSVAIAQFWPDWVMILVVLGVFVIGQVIEGNFLQPKLVGEAVGLHPVWLMFALLAFGTLGGFLGLLLAVPVAAALGVLARHGLKLYLHSRYYLGDGATDSAASLVVQDDLPLEPVAEPHSKATPHA